MQIFVKTMSGGIITLNVESGALIQDVKQQLWYKENIPCHRQRLTYVGKHLEDHRTLFDYMIQHSSTVYWTYVDTV